MYYYYDSNILMYMLGMRLAIHNNEIGVTFVC